MPKYLPGKQRAMVNVQQSPPAEYKPRPRKGVPKTENVGDSILKLGEALGKLAKKAKDSGEDSGSSKEEFSETGIEGMHVRGGDTETTIPKGKADSPPVTGAPGSNKPPETHEQKIKRMQKKIDAKMKDRY